MKKISHLTIPLSFKWNWTFYIHPLSIYPYIILYLYGSSNPFEAYPRVQDLFKYTVKVLSQLLGILDLFCSI